MTLNWKDILLVKISDDLGISVNIGPIVLAIILVISALVAVWIYNKRSICDWQIIEAEVSLGGIGKIKIKPTFEDIQIAHKAWVELATRKAGVPFDEKHDVIIEVYDSWYELFKEMRNLTKQIPADKIRNNEGTRELVRLLVEALNDGLRPHLTCWQAKFRRWYDAISKTQPQKTPQEVQQGYQHYSELVEDLKQVNRQLIEYTEVIRSIAHGKQQ